MAIGANLEALAVDANLERVLSRYYGFSETKGNKLQKKIQTEFLQEKIIKERSQLSFREFNEALMDLGRVLCQSNKASCSLCPLSKACVAHQKRQELDFPVVDQKSLLKPKEDLFIKLLRVVVKEKNKYLMYQKDENEWLAGQWELPTFVFETNDVTLKQYPSIKFQKKYEKLDQLKSGITKYKILNFILETDYQNFLKIAEKTEKEYVFKKVEANLNLSSTCIKILGKI
jgi:A/G-specific adenine glycosylase